MVEVQRTDSLNYLFATVESHADAARARSRSNSSNAGRSWRRTHPWRIDARARFRAAPRLRQRRRDLSSPPTVSPMAIRPTTASRACARPRTARQSNGRHGGDPAGIRRHLDYIASMAYPAADHAGAGERPAGRSPPRLRDHRPLPHRPRAWVRTTITALSREAKAQGASACHADVVLNHIGSGHWWMRTAGQGLDQHPGRYVETNDRRTTIRDRTPRPRTARAVRAGAGCAGDARPQPAQPAPRALSHPEQPLVDRNRRPVRHPRGHLRLRRCRFSQRLGQGDPRRIPGFSMVGEEWSPNPAIVAHWQRGKSNPTGTCRTCRA